jgi:transcriptional regulator of acetoin/glycerol metabolism
VDDLPPEFRAAQGVGEDATLEARAVRMVERCGGNKSRAAERLGMSRTRLYRVLQDAARRDRDDATAMIG